MAEIHVGDVGTAFLLTIKDQDGAIVDISDATTLSVVFTLPDKTSTTKTGETYTDGTDGIVRYVTIAGDLSQAGRWKLQAVVTLPGGDGGTWHSEIHKFAVKANLGS